MNPSVADILRGTPIWVFLLLGYLVWRSLLALRARVIPLYQVWIIPGVFIVSGILGLFNRNLGFSEALVHWSVGAIIGGALGLLSRPGIRFDRDQKLVWLPGSVQPLLRLLLIFGAHYALTVQAVLNPAMRDSDMRWDLLVSGASAAYFIGWMVRFGQDCNRAGRATMLRPMKRRWLPPVSAD